MSTETPSEEYSVGKVADLAGVTVRTLHHYDEIGLVRPHGRSPAGYRRYSADDIERLQQVLIYRRLGFSLDEIAPLLDDPAVDALEHLRRQRDLLVRKGAELAEMVRALDEQLAARNRGMRLTPEEQLEIFGTDKVGGEWADEAERHWGEIRPSIRSRSGDRRRIQRTTGRGSRRNPTRGCGPSPTPCAAANLQMVIVPRHWQRSIASSSARGSTTVRTPCIAISL